MRPDQRFWRWGLILGLAVALSWPIYALAHHFGGLPFLVSLYRAVPQAVLWLLFVVAVYVIAATSWFKTLGDWWLSRPRPGHEVLPGAERPTGRVAALADWLARQPGGPFSRHFVKNVISELAVETLAYQRRTSTRQVRAALEGGALDLSPEVTTYLQAGLELWPVESSLSGRRAWISRLGLGALAAPSTAELETERMLEFLEEQWETPE